MMPTTTTTNSQPAFGVPLSQRKALAAAVALAAALLATDSFAHQNDSDENLEQVSVTGRQINLIGDSISAAEGVIGEREIQLRPLLRTGEVLEAVPGMVVTQHSGTGKANQYFLRGFNLDHGTDFATFVDGMPINMRSHGHGQGYTDLNFIIPETLASISYKKGTYYADVGDFSGAGSAAMTTLSKATRGQLQATLGEDHYGRMLLLNDAGDDASRWFYALEHTRYDGPWQDIDEDLDKTNLLLKNTRTLEQGQLSVSLMAYDNSWNSADQIPARAVSSGLVDELGSVDDTTGGESSRYSLSAQWLGNEVLSNDHSSSRWQASVYAIRYDMTLYSNFTYFLDDPIQGDQFSQIDKRWIYGGNVEYRLNSHWGGRPVVNRFGGEFRYDDIDEVSLNKTQARQWLGSVRSDAIEEFSVGIFWENQIRWRDDLKTVLGVRYDQFDFDVNGKIGSNHHGVDLSHNSGGEDDGRASVKGSLVYTLNDRWESYLAAGTGFHSNDARGTTIRIDPVSGETVAPVDPLAKSTGYEVGVRGFIGDKLNTSLSLWQLELDSELLFVGDAGNTEASRSSKRRGLELTAYYRFSPEWTLDLEYARSSARFTESDPAGDDVPGAIEQVWQAGLSYEAPNGWYGSLRARHFGERPLEESGTIKSDSSTLWNLRAGYNSRDWGVALDLLNLLDSDDHDIDYYYASRLPGDAAGSEIEDIHYHVAEPRTLRLSLSYFL